MSASDRLPRGWRRVSGDEARKLLTEFEREVSPNHALARVALEALGRRAANDDVLLGRVDHPDRVVVVHLTWRGTAESDSRLPIVVFDGPFDRFVEVESA